MSLNHLKVPSHTVCIYQSAHRLTAMAISFRSEEFTRGPGAPPACRSGELRPRFSLGIFQSKTSPVGFAIDPNELPQKEEEDRFLTVAIACSRNKEVDN